MSRVHLLALWVAVVVVAPPSFAQPTHTPDSSLRVTVADTTGGVIVGARVAIRQASGNERQAVTGDRGDVLVSGLVPGAVKVHVESDGFEPADLPEQRLRAGINRLDVRLDVARVAVSVEVTRDTAEKLTDPRGDAFTRVLGPEQIAQLPDDPEDMKRVLETMAGPGVVFRVNGFSSSSLPAKGQIRQIRIGVTAFSAEMHELGVPVVEILTNPGLDRWHGSLNTGFRNAALTARDPFSHADGSERVQRGGLSLDGPIWRNHTSLAITLDRYSLATGNTIQASLPTGLFTAVSTTPSDRSQFSLQLQHVLTRTHTARFELTRNANSAANNGVGGTTLPEHASALDQTLTTLRVADSGPIGKRAFNEARMQATWTDTRISSALAQPSIVVLGAFTGGGAQANSARRSWELEASDDVDFARGRHAMRTGLTLMSGRYRSIDEQNRLGTFLFSGLADYLAARPLTFTRRIGEPLVAYNFYRAAWYFQDDVKMRKTLTVSGGVRHEVQSHIADKLNLSPRAGFTWAPRPNGTLVIRGGAGVAYTWFDSSLYEQTLLVDGERQYDVVVAHAGFPSPFEGAPAVVLPPSRLLQSTDLRLPRLVHFSIGAQRQFSPLTGFTVTYTHQSGDGLFRGHNLNAPNVAGVRPFPAFGNVIEVQSAGRSALDALDAIFTHAVMKEKRLLFGVGASYRLARRMNDTDGAFRPLSDNTNPAADWGPAPSDVRHLMAVFITANPAARARLTVIGSMRSASPYTITTGFDDNGDTIVNDRPAGIGRNSARGDGQADLMLRAGYSIGFGHGGTTLRIPDNIDRARTEAGRDPLGNVLPDANRRYHLEFYVQAYNLLNTTNLTGFRGVQTSPLFGRATGATGPRRVEIGTRFDF